MTLSERIWRAQGWERQSPSGLWTRKGHTGEAAAHTARWPDQMPDYEHDISACFRDLVPEMPKYLAIQRYRSRKGWTVWLPLPIGKAIKGDTPAEAICEAWLATQETT